MSAKHTPGPWRRSPGNEHVFGANGGCVALTKHRDTTAGMAFPEEKDEAVANARLIAAAPELLDALQYALSGGFRHRYDCLISAQGTGCTCDYSDRKSMAEAAIAKAKNQ